MDYVNDIAETLVSEEEIKVKVAELGRRISEDYGDQELVLIGLLRGAIIFLSDLMRTINIPVRLDFIGIQSYGISTESGAVRLVICSRARGVLRGWMTPRRGPALAAAFERHRRKTLPGAVALSCWQKVRSDG